MLLVHIPNSLHSLQGFLCFVGLAWHRDQFHLYNPVCTSGLAAASISQLQVTDTDKKTARGFMSEPVLPLQKAVLFSFFFIYCVCMWGLGVGARFHTTWHTCGSLRATFLWESFLLDSGDRTGLRACLANTFTRWSIMPARERYFLSEVPIKWVARTTSTNLIFSLHFNFLFDRKDTFLH